MDKKKPTMIDRFFGRKKSKQISNFSNDKSAIASTSEPTSTTTRQRVNVRNFQNFVLVWLNTNADEMNDKDYQHTITQLQRVVNSVNIFINIDECIDFLTDIKNGKVFMIITGIFSQHSVSLMRDITQLDSIYIYCKNETKYEQYIKQWPKVKGVFREILPICEALQQPARQCERNSISISFVSTNEGTPIKNLDQLDQTFMYTQILKEILLTMDIDESHIKDFADFCREQFAGNDYQLNNIDKLERKYRDYKPIWWYTYECFLYSMLNQSLRTMDVDIIVKMGFFIRDLHQHIEQLHIEQFGESHVTQPFTVYRGQGLMKTDFDRLMKTKGGLISFNNFLSTSKDRDVSFSFAESNQDNPDLIGILFKIDIDPSISSTPYAFVNNSGCYAQENELLFSMHTVFRIGEIEQINNNDRLWQVELTLTSDNDQELRNLTERIREETFPHSEGSYRLVQLLIKLGEYSKALDLCEILLDQASGDSMRVKLYHMLGLIENHQGDYRAAITFYEKSLEIHQKTLPQDHPDLTTTYNNIGLVYHNMGEYSKALSSYEKAFECCQKTLPSDHPDLASSYENIGMVYKIMGEHSKALSFSERALEIKQKSLPANHPSLINSYTNIGSVYDQMGDCSKAISSYEKALEMGQKALLLNHPQLAISYACLGSIYFKIGEYAKALSLHEKVLEIYHKTLPPYHPRVATACSNIASAYDSMKQYSKAASFYERAVDIGQRSLPANHPRLQLYKKNLELLLKKL